MRAVGVVPQALRLGVGLDQRDLLLAAPGQAQIGQRFGVDREDAAGGAVLGRHVADGGAVGQRQVLQAVAEELDELADHAVLAQHLRHRQHQVGGGGAFGQLAGELEAHHLRDQHRRGLAEHRRFRLDAAHAPAEHADAVDHRGVAVGAEHGVRVGDRLAVALAGHHHPRQVLQVDLVHDAGVRRHHLEVVEGLLAPAQEAVAFLVALEFDLAVEVQRVGLAEHVHLHRMVDHQFRGDQRVDLLRASAELDHRIAHRRQVDHAGHAGEVLQHHARRHEGDLGVGFGLGIPLGHCLDVVLAHGHAAVFVAQQVFQQDLQRVGQAGDIEALGELGQAVVGVALAVDLERGAGGKGIAHHGTPMASRL
ncbi:hypothetical protein NB689_000944 [Xanthomonas sacchari]|nr:hypothetical protein [Xanthomonas sacchari]